MDYKELVERLEFPSWQDIEDPDSTLLSEAAAAITDLLARAEAVEARCSALEKMVKEYQENLIPGYRVRAEKAEARVRELETSFRTEKCENGPECAELGRARKRAEEAEALAEKAERERDEYFKHLQGFCFCCAHRTDGFDCKAKCYGHKRGSAWVYAGAAKEE